MVAHVAQPARQEAPKTLAEARSSTQWPQWEAACEAEMAPIMENGTWELVDAAPPDKRVLPCKWVFTIKRAPDGSVERYKARLAGGGPLPLGGHRASGLVSQGHALGTLGEIEVEVEVRGSQVTAVQVGGSAAVEREGVWNG